MALVLLSIASFFVYGLKLGIDFKGGALMEVFYPAESGRPDIQLVKNAVSLIGNSFGEAMIQPIGINGYSIKTLALTEENRLNLISALSIQGEYELVEESFTSIGPSVGRELGRKAIIAIILVIIAIILFIAFVFRSVNSKLYKGKGVSSWRLGFIAIITLIHDILITTGFFIVLSHFLGLEADTLFIVALLTILGVSINDTIVVFDRIRENIHNDLTQEFGDTVGKGLDQSFTRSINTSLILIMVLLALFFWGPVSIKYFALTLTVGIFIGTYSSLFLASPLLVIIEQLQRKK